LGLVMARKKQVADSKRRIPQQARARDTVEVIVEATARIFVARGGRGAEYKLHRRAGRHQRRHSLRILSEQGGAILLAMGRREITRVTAAVVRAISSADSEADPARLAIRALITEFSRHRKAPRIAFQTLVAEGFGAELEASMDEIAGALAARTERIISNSFLAAPVAAFLFLIVIRQSKRETTNAPMERTSERLPSRARDDH
jgi:hypothetical protein